VKPLRRSRAALTAAASAAALTLAPGAPARAARAPGWHLVFTSHYGRATNYSGYTAVVAPDGHDAWAFGSTSTAGLPAPGSPVAERWNGTTWQRSPLPPGLSSEIFAASAVSASDVWAVTEAGGDILHWDGARWSVARHVPGPGAFTGIAALGGRDVWAFGGPGAGPGLGAWHYDGRAWTRVPGAAGRVLTPSAVSATDIWATGSASSEGDVILHYDGSGWRRVTAPALAGLGFGEILAQPGTGVWATAVTGGGGQRLVHFGGGRWSTTVLPWPDASLGFLAPDGRGGLWLDLYGAAGQAWVSHRSARGRWSRTALPAGSVMAQLAPAPGGTSLWAVGGIRTKAGSDAGIWSFGPGGQPPRVPASLPGSRSGS
jgi:hypothetical protein